MIQGGDRKGRNDGGGVSPRGWGPGEFHFFVRLGNSQTAYYLAVVNRELFSSREKDHSPIRENLFVLWFSLESEMNEYDYAEWLAASI